MGYSTLYGDSAGGLAVIKGVPKLLVYEFCRHINSLAGQQVIPQRVLTKAPSAELQPDSDLLPAYEIIDPVMSAYVEKTLTAEAIARRGFKLEDVGQIIP